MKHFSLADYIEDEAEVESDCSNNTYNVEKYINEEQEVYVLKNLSEDEENKLKEEHESEQKKV